MKIFTFIALAVFSFCANADQRMETEQNLCHFAYDPNDDDNEVYFGTCKNVIDTYDAQDGQGRLASGKSTVTAEKARDGMPDLVQLQGSAALPIEGYTVTNTNCQMVTSNYNGDGTNNYTQYNTNDWTLTIKQVVRNQGDKGFVDGVDEVSKRYIYHIECRGGVAQ
jgi:hypothetical protein